MKPRLILLHTKHCQAAARWAVVIDCTKKTLKTHSQIYSLQIGLFA